MTFEDFRDDEVAPWLAVGGEAYVTGSNQTGPLNRLLERFTEETYYLYDDNITFTLSATDSFALRSTTSFSQKLWRPVAVWIDNVPIIEVASQEDMAGLQSTYVSDTAGTPRYWFSQGNELTVYPEASGAISNSRASGWYLHPTCVDATTMLIQDSDLATCAKFCAYHLLEPRATGTMLEKLQEMAYGPNPGDPNGLGFMQQMAKIKARNEATRGSMTRRKTSSIYRIC